MQDFSEDIIGPELTPERDYTFVRYLLVISAVIMAAIFVGQTLFGKNSLEVYLTLQENEAVLKDKIDNLQHENARLQKQYFELKSLLPKEEVQ